MVQRIGQFSGCTLRSGPRSIGGALIAAIVMLAMCSSAASGDPQQRPHADLLDDVPVTFATFTASFSTLNEILQRERWECLDETVCFLLNNLRDLTGIAIKNNDTDPGAGIVIQYALVPRTNVFLCVWSMSINPERYVQAHQTKWNQFEPDSDGFIDSTLFSGGTLLQPGRMTSILVFNAGAEGPYDSDAIRRWLSYYDGQFKGVAPSDAIELKLMPTAIPKSDRDRWMEVIMVGLNPSLQQRDLESPEEYGFRRGLVELYLVAFRTGLFDVESLTFTFQKAPTSNASTITLQVDAVHGSGLEQWIQDTAQMKARLVEAIDESVVVDLSAAFSVPEQVAFVMQAGAVMLISRAREQGRINQSTAGQLKAACQSILSARRLDVALRRTEHDSGQIETDVRIPLAIPAEVQSALMEYLADCDNPHLLFAAAESEGAVLHEYSGFQQDRFNLTRWRLLFGADENAVVFSLAGSGKDHTFTDKPLQQFMQDQSEDKSQAGGSPGLAAEFRANKVLPGVCTAIIPFYANVLHPARWNVSGEKDIGNVTTQAVGRSFIVTCSLGEDAFMWSFTTYLTAVRKLEGFQFAFESRPAKK